MAFTNLLQSSNKAGDEDHDHLVSGASTPLGGAATPQPDPTDKRLPSILSSYFGQVRDSLLPSTSHTGSTDSSTPAAQMGNENSKQHSGEARPGAGGLPTAPNSPKVEGDQMVGAPSLPPHERVGSTAHRNTNNLDPNYPTPPASSASSLKHSFSQESAADMASAGSVKTAGAEGQSHPESAAESSKRRHASGPAASSESHKKPAIHQLSSGLVVSHSNPSDPVISHVHASNPSVTPPRSSSTQETLTSELNSTTEQATPPRTPRTLSYDSRQQNATSQTPQPQAPTAAPAPSQPRDQLKTRNSSTTGPVLGEQKGKLYITIQEARGLRPSVDPYVVCQFQWNEYISRGPRNESPGSGDDGGNNSFGGGIPMKRSDSDMGRPMAIPMKSRQSSQTSFTSRDPANRGREVTDPVWNHEAVFDVVGEDAEADVSVYDHTSQEVFLGHVRIHLPLQEEENVDDWFKLEPRQAAEDHVSGEIHLKTRFVFTEKKHYGPEDFQILKLIGKGTFGQVFQVRKRDTQRVYAMKVLSKKVIVQKKEVAHTLGERNILVRTAMAASPFIVGLKFSFQTPSDLYLVTDYMSGGELFWHLQKEGRFHEARAKFYIAELILALRHLHQHDIVYRDLKPENILLDAHGHIALCDFGLSKANLTKDDTTNTFCGTTEYLAPEVLLDEQGYTKMVDFWSLGVLVFEMCCGWSPFYAEDTQQMYKNIAFGKVRFPRDALSNEGRNFVKGLLNRNPKHRLGAKNDAEELMQHPFFDDVDWESLSRKNVVPPFKPKLKSETDTSNFDPEFTNALNGKSSLNARAAALATGANTASTPLSPTLQEKFRGFTFVDQDESYLANRVAEQGDQDNGDAMEEDDNNENWDYGPASPDPAGDRMSGIQKTGAGEEGFFSNGGGFEV